MNKKVIKPLFLLSFAFCLAFLPPLATFAEEDILSTEESDILESCTESAINIWSNSKLRRYAEDNILYYDDQFEDSCKHPKEPENPCIPSGVDIVIGDNEQSIINSLRAAGYSTSAIAGIMGNLSVENGEFEPRKLELTHKLPDNSQDSNNRVPEDFVAYDLNYDGQQGKRWHGQLWKGGLGLAQWTYWSRLKNLQLYVGANKPVTSLATQIGFLIKELSDYSLPPAVLNSLSYEQAAIRVLDDYEGPDESQRNKEVENRTRNAKNYYLKLLGQDSEDNLENSENPENSSETPLPSNEDCTPSEDDGYTGPVEIDEGGLTLEDAKTLVKNYGFYKEDSNSVVGDTLWNMCNGGGSNCVTFSAFFVNKFTNHPYINGNGATFSIKGLSPAGGPDVFSVFRSKNREPVWNAEKQRWENNGHTGVILGYHDGKYIVGHASCRRQKSGKGDGLKSGNGSAFVVEETAELPTSWTYPGTNYYQFEFFQLKDSVDIDKLKAYIEYGP